MNDSTDDKLSPRLRILLEVCKDEISDQDAQNRDFRIKTAGCLALHLALISTIDFNNTLIALVWFEFILGTIFAGMVLKPSLWFRPFSPDSVVEHEKKYPSTTADELVKNLLEGYSQAIEKNRRILACKATNLTTLYIITFFQILTCLVLHFIIFV